MDTVEVKSELDKIEDAIEAFRNGEIVIVVDDEERENEGDFICATEKITPEKINFMASYGKGLICTPITEKRAKELKLDSMVKKNTDLHGTAFTVSIDYKKKGCTTGISAYDRSTGMMAITQSETKPDDYARPGHIFPLIAKEGGVLRRTGHTEAAVDLAKMAGLYHSGVLVEILNEDGSMARLPELKVIAENLDLRIISIKDLVAYRMKQERLVQIESRVEIDSKYGPLELVSFKEINSEKYHLVVKKGDWEPEEPIHCRVHSSTMISEMINLVHFGDDNLIHKSLEKISEAGKGILVMLMPEKNPYSMAQSFEIMKSQIDNKEAIDLHKKDHNNKQRTLGIGAQILNEMGVRKLKLLTRSSKTKRVGLIGYGLEIIENVDI